MIEWLPATATAMRLEYKSEHRPALYAAIVLVTLFLFSLGVRWLNQPAPLWYEGGILLRSAAPVRIALSGSPSTQPEYSRWRCVGNLEDIDDFEYRACVFSNVCYEVSSADFVFFTASNSTTPPIIYDHRKGEQHTFRQRRATGSAIDADFVALSKWVPYRPRLSWSPRIEAGPLPSSRTMLSGLTALSAPFVPTNLGHVAWDEAFPLLVAMAQLGVYTPQLRILRTHGCDVLKGSSRRVCAKFASAFLGPLLGSRAATVYTLAQLAAVHSNAQHVCFESLLAGGVFDAFNSEELNVGREPLLVLYRARVLAWHGVPHSRPPKQHTILLVHKEGRRGIHNFEEGHANVVSRFGKHATVHVTSFAGMGMAAQLRLVASTTLAISPCGGISMSAPQKTRSTPRPHLPPLATKWSAPYALTLTPLPACTSGAGYCPSYPTVPMPFS